MQIVYIEIVLKFIGPPIQAGHIYCLFSKASITDKILKEV